MTGDSAETSEDFDDLEDGDDSEDRIVADDDDDAELEATSEINVDELVSKIDKQRDLDRKKLVKRRLEELQEQKVAMQDLESTYNINLDDDY